jgi:hypothetical protein
LSLDLNITYKKNQKKNYDIIYLVCLDIYLCYIKSNKYLLKSNIYLLKKYYDKIKLNNIIKKLEIKLKRMLIYLCQVKINIFKK